MTVANVSTNTGSSAGGSSSLTTTFGATPTAGNLLILSVGLSDGNTTGLSCTTPTGWTAGPTAYHAASGEGAVFTFWKIAAGGDSAPSATVTSAANRAWVLEEWSGLAASNPVDISFTAADFFGSGTWQTSAGSTTNANDWIYAAIGGRQLSLTSWGASLTADTNAHSANNSAFIFTATRTLSATGSYQPSATMGTSGSGGIAALAFKQASGDVAVSLPVVNVDLAAPVPSIVAGVNVALPVVNLDLAAPAPAASVTNDATVALPVVNLDLAAPAPTPDGGVGAASVALPVVNVDLAALAPSLASSVNIGLPVVNLNLEAPAASTDGKPLRDRVLVSLYDEDGLTRLGRFTLVRNVMWQEVNSQPGSASFEVALDDPLVSQATARRIVRLTWQHKGKTAAVFGCRLQGDAAELATDGRRWLRFENQPGLLSLLSDAVVYPEYGLKRRSSQTRLFGFMSADDNWRLDGDWLRPSGYAFTEETGHRRGRPPALRSPDPDWIAALWPATHVSPKTINYYRETVTLAEGKYAELVITADNFLTVYLDGEEIVTPDYTDPGGWMHVQSVPLQLAAGDRLFAYKVENAPLANGTGGNPLGLIFVLYEVDNDGKRVGILKQSTAGAASMAVHDNTPSPGWFPAQVLRKLVLEAQDRGVDACSALTIAFTDFHDSTGQRWERRGEFAFDIGTVTVSDIATQLAEAGMDVAVGAETMRLLAWQRRGEDKSATVSLALGGDDGTLVAFQSTETPVQFTRILTQLEDGSWVETVDSDAEGDAGRIESALSLGSATDEGTATDVGSDQLGNYSTPRTSVTSEPSTAAGPVAYIDYKIGDTITVPGPRNVGTMKARVLAITVDATGDTVRAWPEYVEDPTA